MAVLHCRSLHIFYCANMCKLQGREASIVALSTATEAAIAIILSALYLIGWIVAIRDFIKEKNTTEEEKYEARIKIVEDFLAKLHEEDNPA